MSLKRTVSLKRTPRYAKSVSSAPTISNPSISVSDSVNHHIATNVSPTITPTTAHIVRGDSSGKKVIEMDDCVSISRRAE